MDGGDGGGGAKRRRFNEDTLGILKLANNLNATWWGPRSLFKFKSLSFRARLLVQIMWGPGGCKTATCRRLKRSHWIICVLFCFFNFFEFFKQPVFL